MNWPRLPNTLALTIQTGRRASHLWPGWMKKASRLAQAPLVILTLGAASPRAEFDFHYRRKRAWKRLSIASHIAKAVIEALRDEA